MDKIQENLLAEIADLHGVPEGAYNIRSNGVSVQRNCTANIDIETKNDKSGIDIYIRPGTKNESVHIPVILDKNGLKEKVYNDFHIGEGADVVIVAGCGIHCGGADDMQHDGIHTFYVEKNARVKYIEKHYGEGDGNGKRVLNPETVIYLAEGAYMEMEATQIKGVDSTVRVTKAKVGDNAKLVIHEKIMTHGKKKKKTDFIVDLDGENSAANVVSRSVAKDNSKQIFISNIRGNNKCSGHTECDAIIMDNANVSAIPEIVAGNVDASLIHEAAIGKIAGEQLVKLMTLGLTEKQAEEQIVSGFLR